MGHEPTAPGRARHPAPRTATSLALLLGLALAASACRSAPARFYVLTPRAEPTPVRNQVELALAPVVLPSLLDRPQLVTVVNGSERHLSEEARWAEDLGDNVTAVVAENLSRLLATERLVRLPAARGTPFEHVLHVELLRLDARPGAAVELEARWRLERADRVAPPAVPRRSRVRVELAGDGDEALVEGISQALLELSRELAGGLDAADDDAADTATAGED